MAMGCYNCEKKFAGGEQVYLNKDPKDKRIYCENCAPEDPLVLGQSAATNVIAGRNSVQQEEINAKNEDPGATKEEVIEGESKVVRDEPKVELKVELELTKQQKSVVDFGFNDLEKSIKKWRDQNKGTIVTDENFKDMKSLDGLASKEAKKIDDFRKTVKKTLTADIKVFEDNCKKLIGYINEVRDPWKEQFETFAEKERQAKKEKVLAIIQEIYIDRGLDVNYQTIEVTDRHLLKSTTFKAIKEDIGTKADKLLEKQTADIRAEEDAKAQKQLNIDYVKLQVQQANDLFKVNLKEKKYLNKLEAGVDPRQISTDISSDAQSILSDREDQLKKEEEAARESFKQEEDHGIEPPEVIVQNGERYDSETAEHLGPSENLFEEQYKQEKQTPKPPKVYTLTFEVTGTYKQLVALKNFFDNNKELKYEEKGITEVK